MKSQQVIQGIKKYHQDIQYIWKTRLQETQDYNQLRFITMSNFWSQIFEITPSDFLQLIHMEKKDE